MREIFPVPKLEHLMKFTIMSHPCSPDDSAVIRRLCLNGRLEDLNVECGLEGLFPTAAPWADMPQSLQHLTLYFSLENGIPEALEHLLNLKDLTIYHEGSGCMDMTRPLDPFIDLLSLRTLKFMGVVSRHEPGESSWTPNALRLLGMAKKRIVEQGRNMHLRYQYS